MGAIEVLRPGALTTIQDLGRPGHAHLGVPHSGAADTVSLRLANRLVGNPQDAAALETTLVGPRLRLLRACTVALTGAPVRATACGRPVAMNAAVALNAGDELSLSTASAGLRTYIAFAGGLRVDRVFGSSSTDTLTGLGPAPLGRGQRLPVGEPAPTPTPDAAPGLTLETEPRLGVVPGPRADRFTERALERLVSEPFYVTSDSNRIGLRLEGPSLPRLGSDDLRSEGLAHGSIQVPPSGHPILLLADHPTTGGYPVIAVVRSADLPVAGQLRPGATLRFFTASV